jgi:hypothetical protein
MRAAIMILGTLVAMTGRGAEATETTPVVGRRLFLDVHDLGAGKVTVKAVAGAHQRDLNTEAKHGVAFKAYWVDEKAARSTAWPRPRRGRPSMPSTRRRTA